MATKTKKPKGTVKGSERPQNKNLKPFKKGQSGNPAGMKPGQKQYATLYREALIKLAKKNGKTSDDLEVEMLTNAFTRAHAGDYRFYKDILDRIHGTALQKASIEVQDTAIPQEIDAPLKKAVADFEKAMKAVLKSKPK